MVIEKNNKEIIREYAHRWKNKIMHVQPPLWEKEIVTLFANTFKSLYYKHLIGSSYVVVVVIIEIIEQTIRASRISKLV
jgi:hypothetical protein